MHIKIEWDSESEDLKVVVTGPAPEARQMADDIAEAIDDELELEDDDVCESSDGEVTVSNIDATKIDEVLDAIGEVLGTDE